MIFVLSEGSPGPLLSIIPSGVISIISFAEVSYGTVIISQPRLHNSRAILAFAPKSHKTTFFTLLLDLFFSRLLELVMFFLLMLTDSTASLILYCLISSM